MSVTIPLEPIAWVLVLWMLVGLVLYLPLRFWAREHISPRQSWQEMLWPTWGPRWRRPFTVLTSAALWPFLLADLVGMERRWPSWTRRWRR